MPEAGPLDDLPDRTRAFFRPAGGLERGSAGEAFPYETRPQQQAMAEAVAGALADHAHLAVEAGTGVGKSFAYLVPMILAARASGQKVVIATHTIALQEQLVRKDIPFLRAHLGDPFNAVLVKGKSNYLCLRRLARARKHAGDLFRHEDAGHLDRVQAWVAATEDGSLQNLHPEPPSDVWSEVCVEDGNCLQRKCPEYAQCFFFRARARARQADVLVANHHLLFVDLALRSRKNALLPNYSAVVLDEAHAIEEVASEHFGLRVSPYMIEHWCRRLYHPERARGLLGSLRDGPGCTLVERVWEAQQRFFFDLERLAGFDAQGKARRVAGPIPTDTRLAEWLGKAGDHLAGLAQRLEATDRDTAAEIRQAARRAGELQAAITDFLEQRREDHVYWLACEGRRRQTVMYTAPIEVAPLLRDWMFKTVPCVVMTSATLAVHGSLDYFMERVGARGLARSAIEGSPFEYNRQMRILIPERMPEPNAGDYQAALTEAISRLSEQQGGGTLVLFTNASLMRRVADAARPRIQNAGLRLLVQGQGVSRTALLEEFRLNQGAVLFGLDSFWMGVDVRGEALRLVVITRLPFAVPDHPLIRARMDRIKERGGDPFREYSLPEAVIQFRQGVGRLIRTATDQGVVAVLDRRIVDRWYGRWFREALPECPVETADLWGAPAPDAGEEPPGGEDYEW